MEDEIVYGSEINWEVTDVVPREDYTLLLTFIDGSKKIYDFRPLLKYEVYQKFNDINFFMQAKVAYSTVVWSDSIDIDPEDLYEDGISVE